MAGAAERVPSEGGALICEPVAPGVIVVAGSVQMVCAECAVGVWVAPTGQRRLGEQLDLRPVCVPCGLALMLRDGKSPEPISAEQRAEVAATMFGYRNRN